MVHSVYSRELFLDYKSTMKQLLLKQSPSGQWQYMIKSAEYVYVEWQWGTYNRETTIEQARSRFSFDEIA